MASYFFDTSALAKRYIEESGSEWVSAICEKSTLHLIFISEITEVELVSALIRRGKGKIVGVNGPNTGFSGCQTKQINQ